MLTFFSPAKLNLFLRILERRADGYHNLASLFQAIDLGDTLSFSFAEKDSFICSDRGLACGSSNLVIKSLELFRKKTGIKLSVLIHLEKRIPVQAGLGGGSSNAATTLWGLNALNGNPASEKELQSWSHELGSDVPFFFSSGTAYCQGRGEIVDDLPNFPLPHTFNVIKPKEGLSTGRIFRELNLAECSREHPEQILRSFYTENPLYINDLEAPAFRLLPFLVQLKKDFSAAMTGSGTAFFCGGKKVFKDDNLFSSQVTAIRRSSGSWYKKNASQPVNSHSLSF